MMEKKGWILLGVIEIMLYEIGNRRERNIGRLNER